MKEKIVINKFGGAIMGSRENVLMSVDHIKKQIEAGLFPVTVVSAFKGMTDKLIGMVEEVKSIARSDSTQDRNCDDLIEVLSTELESFHREIVDQYDLQSDIKKTLLKDFHSLILKFSADLNLISRFGDLPVFHDRILSYGEKLSSLFFTALLNNTGIKAKRFKDREIGIHTDDRHLDANIDLELSVPSVKLNLLKEMKSVPVVMGFTGQNSQGQITTLGRDGSDTTACFLGYALEAEKIILWKEVAGIRTADPRIVENVLTVDYVNYDEAEESGKVLCDKAVRFLKMSKSAAEIAYIRDSSVKTIIGPVRETEEPRVKMISVKRNLTLMIMNDEQVKQYGFLYKITQILNTRKMNMVLIRNTRDTLFVVVDNGGNGLLQDVLQDLKSISQNINTISVKMVSIVGSLTWDMVNQFNTTLLSLSPDVILGSFPYKNCVRLEAIVKDEDVEKVIRGFHQTFIS